MAPYAFDDATRHGHAAAVAGATTAGALTASPPQINAGENATVSLQWNSVPLAANASVQNWIAVSCGPGGSDIDCLDWFFINRSTAGAVELSNLINMRCDYVVR